MKKRFLKPIAWLLTLAVLMTLLPGFTLGVSAATTSGTTGDCTWIFDDATGVLTISGSGTVGNEQSWIEHVNSITSLVIEDGITSIANYAFYEYSSLKSVTLSASVTTIGNYAFAGCSNLESVTIPASVTAIGNAVFYGCSSLVTVNYLGTLEPSMGSYVFIGCNCLTHVIVSEAYTESTFGGIPVVKSEIPTPTTYTVTASASPAEGGTVTGGGTYEENESVTVTATANDGYKFVKWTENGADVSTNASYTFTATEDRNLVASFAAAVPTITGMTVKVNDVVQPAGEVAVSEGDTITIIYHGENLDLLPTYWENSNYQLKLGNSTTWLTKTSSNYTVDAANGTVTVIRGADRFDTNNNNNRTIGYKHKDDSSFTLLYTIIYQTATPPVVPEITGVKVLINGVEQPEGEIFIADSDEVTVIYVGENFEELGLNNQNYKYRIGPYTGNFYDFTIDTTTTPHTATRTFTGSSINYSRNISYTNKGESETVTGYIIKKPGAPDITDIVISGNGVVADPVNKTYTVPINETITVTISGTDFDKITAEDYTSRLYRVVITAGSSLSLVERLYNPETGNFIFTTQYNDSQINRDINIRYTTDGGITYVDTGWKVIVTEPLTPDKGGRTNYIIRLNCEDEDSHIISSMYDNRFASEQRVYKNEDEKWAFEALIDIKGMADALIASDALNEHEYVSRVPEEKIRLTAIWSREEKCWNYSSTYEYTISCNDEFIVTFNANGGACEATSVETVDGKLSVLPTPTRTGYKFDGWFDAAEGGNAVTTDKVYTENTTIHAQWTEKQTVTITEATQTYTYDDTVKAFQINGIVLVGFTVKYQQDGQEVTPKNAGTYDVVITRTEDGNYKKFEKTLEDALVIEKAQVVINVDTTPIVKTYGDTWALPTATSNSGTVTVDKTVAEMANAGSYTVTYTVVGDDNYNGTTKTVSITINPKPITGATVGNFAGLTYTGSAQTPAATVTIGDLTVTGAWSAVTNVSDTTTFTANGNFTGTIENQETGMLKADPSFTEPTAKTGLVYNGSAQELLNPGTAEGGTMKYFIGGTQATETVSTRTSAGEYTVTCIIAGDENHNNMVVGEYTVTIARKSIEDATVALLGALTYNGSEQTQEVSVTLDGFTVTFDVTDNKATNVKTDGNYTLKVTANGSFVGEKTLEWNILKATPVQSTEKVTSAKADKGKVLSDATVTEGEFLAVDGAVLEGSFAWVDDTEKITSDTVKQMTFTPYSANYESVIFDVFVDVKTLNYRPASSIPGYSGNKTEITPQEEETKPDENPDGTETNPDEKTETKVFEDVHDENHWATEDVDYVYENGLMKGESETKFSPDGAVTRAMLVTVLYRLEGEPAVSGITSFADLEEGQYYLDAVCWAQINGIVKGYSETEFHPDEKIIREQIAAILFRYAQYKGMDAVTMEENLHFADSDEISGYAVSAMNWAVGKGLIKGKTDKTLAPGDTATRAEMAAILHRFIESIK